MNIINTLLHELGIDENGAPVRKLQDIALEKVATEVLNELQRGSAPESHASASLPMVKNNDKAPESVAMPRTSPGQVRSLTRKISSHLESWVGRFEDWLPLAPVADAPLSFNTIPRPYQRPPEPTKSLYVGAEVPLATLFSPDLLRCDLAWAMGPLQVTAARDEHGMISSVLAAVRTRDTALGGTSIILELTGEDGSTVRLRLNNAKPSMVRKGTSLLGDWRKLVVRVGLDPGRP